MLQAKRQLLASLSDGAAWGDVIVLSVPGAGAGHGQGGHAFPAWGGTEAGGQTPPAMRRPTGALSGAWSEAEFKQSLNP